MRMDAAGKMSARTVTIDGLTDKESFISDPWTQLYQLMQSVAHQLQWKITKLLHSEGSELISVFYFSLYSSTCYWFLCEI